MSISGILTSSYNQYQLGAASNPYQQDMQKLSQDLQAGNLSASQSDFAALQAAFSQPASSTTAASPASTSVASTFNPITQAINQLATDLQSGNVPAAQKDLSTLQQDFKNHAKLPIEHYLRQQPSSGGGDSSTQNSLLQDLSKAGQNLTSSSLAGAQQAYATLQQELQQFALGSGALSSESSSLLAQMPVSLEA